MMAASGAYDFGGPKWKANWRWDERDGEEGEERGPDSRRRRQRRGRMFRPKANCGSRCSR